MRGHILLRALATGWTGGLAVVGAITFARQFFAIGTLGWYLMLALLFMPVAWTLNQFPRSLREWRSPPHIPGPPLA